MMPLCLLLLVVATNIMHCLPNSILFLFFILDGSSYSFDVGAVRGKRQTSNGNKQNDRMTDQFVSKIRFNSIFESGKRQRVVCLRGEGRSVNLLMPFT